MQDLPTTFRGLIDCWPSGKAFGRQICGNADRGRIFYRRNRVPKQLWPSVIKHAPEHGLVGVDNAYLATLYEAGRGEGR